MSLCGWYARLDAQSAEVGAHLISGLAYTTFPIEVVPIHLSLLHVLYLARVNEVAVFVSTPEQTFS